MMDSNSKVSQLHFRADLLAAKFQQGEGECHIDEAITLDREALELCPSNHPERSASLTLLSIHLNDRYNHSGEITDLEEAIKLGRDALFLCPPGHPDHSATLNNLVYYLVARHNQLGRMEDVNEAIIFGREALDLHPPGHPDRSISLDNLTVCLFTRYSQLGKVEDLNDAILFGRAALSLRPPGHPHRSTSLDNLAVYLATRYDHLRTIEDINEAIFHGRGAKDLCSLTHPERPRILDNLGTYLAARYKNLEESEDINEAILLGREALILRPPGNPDRSLSYENLAAYLSIRYLVIGEIDNLHESILLGRNALSLRPYGNPGRPTSLENLAARLFRRYQRLKKPEDLGEAIVVGRDALALLPQGHPNRSQTLEFLATFLRARFTESCQPKDKEELFNLYSQIVHIPSTVSSADLSAARAWIRAAEDFNHPTTLLAYDISLRLLVHHLASLPSLPQHLDVIKNITSSLAVDAFSACLRNGSPTKAVENLEQGRSVFLNQLTRLRSSPLDDLKMSGSLGKTLADRFMELTSLIRIELDSPAADQHDRVWSLNVELERVVSDIRGFPGLSRFLLPWLFNDLQKAASGGPVVIVNASKNSCDALIVLLDQDPIHVPLQITRDRVRDISTDLYALTVRTKRENITPGKYFAVILRELWNKIVSPIVDVLQTIHPIQSRIWWCPTAEFCLLPLHAAGSYRTGQLKLSDLYISSYTPTLTALIHARRYAQSDPITQEKRFIAIGQATTPGQSKLPSVSAELANIGQRVKTISAFKSIEGSDSCVSRVSDELDQNEWVHLACHGLPNRKKPFESAFALHDGRFTVERILRRQLDKAQFAYLSACHTTVGDEECPDEMIHLASAMQFSGFRSVIGTMWAVDDGQTQKITSMFYDNMIDESGRLDHTRAAFALHRTMQTLEGISFDQRILYIHLGA